MWNKQQIPQCWSLGMGLLQSIPQDIPTTSEIVTVLVKAYVLHPRCTSAHFGMVPTIWPIVFSSYSLCTAVNLDLLCRKCLNTSAAFGKALLAVQLIQEVDTEETHYSRLFLLDSMHDKESFVHDIVMIASPGWTPNAQEVNHPLPWIAQYVSLRTCGSHMTSGVHFIPCWASPVYAT